MTALQNAALMIAVWGVVQFILLLLWWRVSHRQRDDEITRDDLSGLNLFDDGDS